MRVYHGATRMDAQRSSFASRPPDLTGRARCRGFSLTELLVAGVIIGVMASVTVPRFVDGRQAAERSYYEDLAGVLTISRKLAMASGCPVRVEIDADGYRALQRQPSGERCTAADARWDEPAVGTDGEFLAGGAPMGVTAAPAVVWVFEPGGGTDLSEDQTITINTRSLVVRAASGYVETD
jgi:MSHA pilin protein MshC